MLVAAAFTSPAIAEKAAQSPARKAESYYRQGIAAEKAGDPAAAIKAYQAALKVNPKHANAQYSLGQVKINSKAIAARGREAKLGAVVIPEFKLAQASLKDALEALELMVEKESKGAQAPSFIIQDPKGLLAKSEVTLVLKNTPTKVIMKYLLDQTGTKARYDEYAIVITPRPGQR